MTQEEFDVETPSTNNEGLLQVFTWMGSKKRAAETVWQYLGTDITRYAEPFAGSGAVWLNAPEPNRVTNAYLNDWDCHIANVLRSIRYHPDEVTEWACHPRLEIDLHMVHDYIYNGREKMRGLLATGLEACDPKWAGLWIWGCNNWLGGNWGTCSIKADELALANRDLDECKDVEGTIRKKLNSSNRATERLVPVANRDLDECKDVEGTRRRKLNSGNQATERLAPDRYEHVHGIIMRAYAILRDTKILNGDFERLLTDSYLKDGRPSGVYMDPPYPDTNIVNNGNTYGDADVERDTFHRAITWYIGHCEDNKLRIVFSCQRHNLTGFDIPSDVRIIEWKRQKGYSSGSSGKAVSRYEVMLISKACKTI